MGLGQFRPTRDYDEHEIIPNLQAHRENQQDDGN